MLITYGISVRYGKGYSGITDDDGHKKADASTLEEVYLRLSVILMKNEDIDSGRYLYS